MRVEPNDVSRPCLQDLGYSGYLTLECINERRCVSPHVAYEGPGPIGCPFGINDALGRGNGKCHWLLNEDMLAVLQHRHRVLVMEFIACQHEDDIDFRVARYLFGACGNGNAEFGSTMVCRFLGYITNGDNGIQVVQQQQNRRKESFIKKAYEDQLALLYWLLCTLPARRGTAAGDRSLAICQKLRPHIYGALSGSKVTMKPAALLPIYPLFYLCTSKHREPKIAFGLRARSSKDDSRFSATHPGPPRTRA
jgi:hypothetical protein